MGLAEVIIIALAAYRLAFFVVEEAAPFSIMVKLRARLGASNQECGNQRYSEPYIRNPLCCVLCTSMYTSAMVYAAWAIGFHILVYWLAIAGGVLVMQRVGSE